MKKKNNQLKITVYGYDVDTTEEATRLVTERLAQLKLKSSSGPFPLPVKKKRTTVPISPHKHKDSQEQFERRIHRRVIIINVLDISKTALKALESLENLVPATASFRLKALF